MNTALSIIPSLLSNLAHQQPQLVRKKENKKIVKILV